MMESLESVMSGIDFPKIMRELTESGRYTQQLWYNSESMAFIARGRAYRSEFHINPSYEIQYSLRGDQHLHYRTPEGDEKVVIVPEGSCIFQPPFVPHSPRFAPDAFQFVVERARTEGEVDRFHWFCESCGALTHEEVFTLSDYENDPVGRAYDNFYESVENRTCGQCGTVAAGRDDA